MVTMHAIKRGGVFASLGLAAMLAASCTDLSDLPKHMRPLESSTRELIKKKGMEDKSPILVRIFKEESVLEVWKQEKASSRYALLKTYDICKWSGDLGPKKAEGDRQAPEGFYTITPAQMNPKSSYHLAFNLGYPNAYDQSLGRTGSHLMVHGACSSRGCYSMDDEQIQEIYTLARLAFQGGQRNFQVQAFPFRMTPENMAKHRKSENAEFWAMLKEGYDHFEVMRQPPKVDVCSKRYVFNSVPQDGVTFSASHECPQLSVPEPIRVAVAEKQSKDETAMMVIAARLEADEEKVRMRAEQAAATMLAKAEPAPAPQETAVASLPASTASLPNAKPGEQSAPAAFGAEPQSPAIATAYAAKPERQGIISSFFSRIMN